MGVSWCVCIQVLSCPAFSGAGATGRIAEEVVPAEDVDRNFQLVNGLVYGRCQNYRTEVEEYEGTVIYRTLLFYNII